MTFPFKFCIIFLFFSPILPKYIVTYPNEPYSSCLPTSNDFSGLDISYTQILMNQMNFSLDFQFFCANFSDPSTFPDPSEILFFIGGISDSNIDYFITQEMTPSLPIISSGISILLYKENESWVFFRQFSWETIFLMIVYPLIIGTLFFFFENRKFAWEDYLWSAYSALFLLNNLKITSSSSRVMLFSLWLMGFIIWTFCFAGAFSTLYLTNPIYQIKSAYNLNDKLVLTQQTYFENIALYGGKPQLINKDDDFSLSNFKSFFNDKPNVGAIVLEDPLVAYIEKLDNEFLRVDANFFP